MTNESSESNLQYNAATAVKKTAKERGFSPIWIIPIVAVVIGLFLIYRVVSETGPTITISFKEGSGLEAGKTKVKFKDVEIGQVADVELIPDMSGVIATVEMHKEAKSYMREKTRFWVVKPRVSASSISGLGTLLSGVYIGVDPVKEGKPTKAFVGLERPPVVQSDDPGTSYLLQADQLGGIDFGAPVYYKQILAGQVVNYELQDSGHIEFQVFIKKPYDSYVNEATRFWNASGIDVNLSANGLDINSESLAAVLGGGIAFDTAKGLGLNTSRQLAAGHKFQLYRNQRDSQQRKYREKRQWLMYFDDPIRGLVPGAPVELRGYRIGEVLDIKFEFDTESREFRIPVLIQIEPERISVVGESDPSKITMDLLVARGLRAQLKTGNLVFGKLLVELDFHPDAPAATIDFSGDIPVFPTIQSTLGGLITDARALVAELRQVGKTLNVMLESREFQAGLTDLSQTLGHINQITAQLDEEAAPEIAAVLKEVSATLQEARTMIEADSTTRSEIIRLLIELAEAAQSVRQLADYLEQHPESLIRGKD